jgi:hypothetical protein
VGAVCLVDVRSFVALGRCVNLTPNARIPGVLQKKEKIAFVQLQKVKEWCFVGRTIKVTAALTSEIFESGATSEAPRVWDTEHFTADKEDDETVRRAPAPSLRSLRRSPSSADTGAGAWLQLARIVDPGYSEIKPKYSQKGSLKPEGRIGLRSSLTKAVKVIEELVQKREIVDLVEEFVPAHVKEKLELVSWVKAIQGIHQPKTIREISDARRRLAFEELYLMQVHLLRQRYHLVAVPDPQRQASEGGEVQNGLCLTGIEAVERIKPALFAPHGLTPCQERCLSEMLTDMSGPQPMLRLLQGDVGSGKTAVAFLSLMAVICSKWQGALVVPTEVRRTLDPTAMEELRIVT